MTRAVLFVAGTPLAYRPHPAEPAGSARDEASPDEAFVRWHDRVVGVGASLTSRTSAVADGQPLDIGADAQAQLARLIASPVHEAGSLVLADDRACWTLEALDSAVPEARYLLLVESPVRALVHWLALGDGDDPHAALAAWRAGTRRLWRHAQRHGPRCLLVQADEAHAHPTALREALEDRGWPLWSPGDRTPIPIEPDPLAWALSESIVAGDADSRDLHEELLAASVPLGPQAEGEASLAWERRIDAQAATTRLRQLVSAHAPSVENERLLLRLHQVQGELEHYFVAYQSLAGNAGWASDGPALPDPGQLTFGAERTEPPHRQIDATLLLVTHGDRQIDRLDVRLVNHHGRPGILFFGGGDRAPPLGAWHVSGQEGDRPYCLLMPSEPAGSATLAQLGTSDWQLTNDVLRRLERALRNGPTELRDRWLPTALRLQADLNQLPTRFRYDSVQVAADAASPGGPLRVSFERVLAGSRAQARVDLRWQPSRTHGDSADMAPLCLLADADKSAQPLLQQWPISADGRWADAVALPVGNGLSRADKGRAWDTWSDTDRTVVLSLLDALPGAVRAMPDAKLPDGVTREALDAAARALIRDARRMARYARMRHAVRMLRRRLRGR